MVWVSPDNASLHYNNSAEILKRLTLSLLQNNYNVDPIIYVYTFDNINSTNSSYDGIPVEYISSPLTLIGQDLQYDLNIVFFDGYRFPDRLLLLWINLLELPNVQTFYIQHGRYTKLHRKYISSNVIKKTFFYSIFLVNASFYMPFSILRLVFSKKLIYIDFGFIYSPSGYWLEYHKSHGLIFDTSFLIPDRDMNRFSLQPVSSLRKKRSFLYIAQTLVEDGRCSKSDFLDFWRSLVDFAVRNDLCIDLRLHPRSNKKLWDKIFDEATNVDLEVITSTQFMRYDFVITHNSAMSVFFLNNSIPVYFFRLSSEPLPLGLATHPYSYPVDNSTNIYESLISLRNRPPLSFPSPTQVLKNDSSTSFEIASEVDLEAKLEELILSILKSSSLQSL